MIMAALMVFAGLVPAARVFAAEEPTVRYLCIGLSEGGAYEITAPDHPISTYDYYLNMAPDEGTQITLKAVPADGYTFAGWYEGIRQMNPELSELGFVTDYDPDKLISSDAEYSFTLTADTNIYALFEKIPCLTLHWSSIDGVDLMDPVKIEITPGMTLSQALATKGWNMKTKVFTKDGYYPVEAWTPEPVTAHDNYTDLWNSRIGGSYKLSEDTDIYYPMMILLDSVEFSVKAPVCGTSTECPEYKNPWEDQTNPPSVSTPSGVKYAAGSEEYGWLPGVWFKEMSWISDLYQGEFTGGTDYYADVLLSGDYGYFFNMDTLGGPFTGELKVNGCEVSDTIVDGDFLDLLVKVTADHDWDEGVVTKAATTSAAGIRTYTCKHCGKTRTEEIPKLTPEPKPTPTPAPAAADPAKQMGEDGTPLGKGASAQAAEKAITTSGSEEGPSGSTFGLLQLKSTKQTKNSIKLTWSKVSGAKTYVLYANKCGKKNKYLKLASYTGKSATIKKVAGAKLKKGTYYKFLMVALDGKGNVISASKTVHAATKGGKVGNDKKVTTKAKKNKVTVKVKKTFKLKAKAVPASKSLKVKKHRGVAYETSDPTIATVTKKGVIKGKKKGKCTVYAYAQNGVCVKIKVTVK